MAGEGASGGARRRVVAAAAAAALLLSALAAALLSAALDSAARSERAFRVAAPGGGARVAHAAVRGARAGALGTARARGVAPFGPETLAGGGTVAALTVGVGGHATRLEALGHAVVQQSDEGPGYHAVRTTAGWVRAYRWGGGDGGDGDGDGEAGLAYHLDDGVLAHLAGAGADVEGALSLSRAHAHARDLRFVLGGIGEVFVLVSLGEAALIVVAEVAAVALAVAPEAAVVAEVASAAAEGGSIIATEGGTLVEGANIFMDAISAGKDVASVVSEGVSSTLDIAGTAANAASNAVEGVGAITEASGEAVIATVEGAAEGAAEVGENILDVLNVDTDALGEDLLEGDGDADGGEDGLDQGGEDQGGDQVDHEGNEGNEGDNEGNEGDEGDNEDNEDNEDEEDDENDEEEEAEERRKKRKKRKKRREENGRGGDEEAPESQAEIEETLDAHLDEDAEERGLSVKEKLLLPIITGFLAQAYKNLRMKVARDGSTNAGSVGVDTYYYYDYDFSPPPPHPPAPPARRMRGLLADSGATDDGGWRLHCQLGADGPCYTFANGDDGAADLNAGRLASFAEWCGAMDANVGIADVTKALGATGQTIAGEGSCEPREYHCAWGVTGKCFTFSTTMWPLLGWGANANSALSNSLVDFMTWCGKWQPNANVDVESTPGLLGVPIGGAGACPAQTGRMHCHKGLDGPCLSFDSDTHYPVSMWDDRRNKAMTGDFAGFVRFCALWRDNYEARIGVSTITTTLSHLTDYPIAGMGRCKPWGCVECECCLPDGADGASETMANYTNCQPKGKATCPKGHSIAAGVRACAHAGGGKLSYTGEDGCAASPPPLPPMPPPPPTPSPPPGDVHFSCRDEMSWRCYDFTYADYDSGEVSGWKAGVAERSWEGFQAFCGSYGANGGQTRFAFQGRGCFEGDEYDYDAAEYAYKETGGETLCYDFSLADYDAKTTFFKAPQFKRSYSGFASFCAAVDRGGSLPNSYVGSRCAVYSCAVAASGAGRAYCVDYSLEDFADAPAKYERSLAGFTKLCQETLGGASTEAAHVGPGCIAKPPTGCVTCSCVNKDPDGGYSMCGQSEAHEHRGLTCYDPHTTFGRLEVKGEGDCGVPSGCSPCSCRSRTSAATGAAAGAGATAGSADDPYSYYDCAGFMDYGKYKPLTCYDPTTTGMVYEYRPGGCAPSGCVACDCKVDEGSGGGLHAKRGKCELRGDKGAPRAGFEGPYRCYRPSTTAGVLKFRGFGACF